MTRDVAMSQAVRMMYLGWAMFVPDPDEKRRGKKISCSHCHRMIHGMFYTRLRADFRLRRWRNSNSGRLFLHLSCTDDWFNAWKLGARGRSYDVRFVSETQPGDRIEYRKKHIWKWRCWYEREQKKSREYVAAGCPPLKNGSRSTPEQILGWIEMLEHDRYDETVGRTILVERPVR